MLVVAKEWTKEDIEAEKRYSSGWHRERETEVKRDDIVSLKETYGNPISLCAVTLICIVMNHYLKRGSCNA